jgi:hypothetical protein
MWHVRLCVGALGLLGTITIGFTIDVYGPIPDNAGGIAGMSCMPEAERALTDCLDATSISSIDNDLCPHERREHNCAWEYGGGRLGLPRQMNRPHARVVPAAC